MTWKHPRRVRQAVQILTLGFYVYLLLAALQGRAAATAPAPLADLFFRLDPLAALAAMVSARVWMPRLALALVIPGLTLLMGRIWCGWLCPLGTLLERVRFRSTRRRAAALSSRWRTISAVKSIKYILLLAVLALALFGNLSLLVLDSITLFTRQPRSQLIHPPGAKDEGDFLARCIRCSQCMQVCPPLGGSDDHRRPG